MMIMIWCAGTNNNDDDGSDGYDNVNNISG